MMKDSQYAFSAGKLLLVKRPMHKRPWLMLFLLILFMGFGVAATMYVYQGVLLPQEAIIVLTQQEYDELIQIKSNQGVHSELVSASSDVNVTPEQLALVFDATFADVRLSSEKRKTYLNAVSKWSTHYAMPPLLVLSIIWRESSFNEDTISRANARGPMQVIYRHHSEKLDKLGKAEQDLHNIDVGIHVGTQVLREYFDRYDRNIFRALAAYVGGQHRTYAQDIMTRYFKSRIFLEEHVKNIGITNETPETLDPAPPKTRPPKTRQPKTETLRPANLS